MIIFIFLVDHQALNAMQLALPCDADHVSLADIISENRNLVDVVLTALGVRGG